METMTNEEKAKAVLSCHRCPFRSGRSGKPHVTNIPEDACAVCFDYKAVMEMAAWKDEQYKTIYLVTKIDLHYDEVERIFFDKEKAEEYCKQFNEDENSYHRNITKIEVS